MTRNTRSRRRRQLVIAAGTDAAARLRKALREDIRHDKWAKCATCWDSFLPSAVDVDHIIPIYKGGTDTDDNVQVLCRTCHKIKTRADMGYKTAPF